MYNDSRKSVHSVLDCELRTVAICFVYINGLYILEL